MGLVDQVLEILGIAAAVRRGEKIRHLVPERRVVRVVRDGHDLNRVIPQVRDALQVLVRELAVRPVAVLLGAHPDVDLVDSVSLGVQRVRRFRVSPLVREAGDLARVPVHAVVVRRPLVLARRDLVDPRGDAVDDGAVGELHQGSDVGAVR